MVTWPAESEIPAQAPALPRPATYQTPASAALAPAAQIGKETLTFSQPRGVPTRPEAAAPARGPTTATVFGVPIYGTAIPTPVAGLGPVAAPAPGLFESMRLAAARPALPTQVCKVKDHGRHGRTVWSSPPMNNLCHARTPLV